MKKLDSSRIVIVGAGVIGCAIANELASSHNEIHVIEKNAQPGEGVSSRNSGVIHAGLYYKPGSLKAKFCIEGNKLLYHWCQTKDVAHEKTTKLIVAQKHDEDDLKKIYHNALKSGVTEKKLKLLSLSEIKKINPNLKGTLALLSLESGIVDPQRFCKSLMVNALQKSVQFHFGYEVKSISDQYTLHTNHGEMPCECVINASGLYADEISKCAGIDRYKIYPWRGDYFKVNLPFKIPKLIYPVRKSNASGLGLHFTTDTQGKVFIGPDVEPAKSKEDFSDQPQKQKDFLKAGQRLIEGLTNEMLSYETCGIRPKLRAFDENEEKDFVISQDRPGFFNLIGIESPGLTAALAIAKHIRSIL